MKILDPDHSLFSNRILTRINIQDASKIDKKSLDSFLNIVKEKSQYYKNYSGEQLSKISVYYLYKRLYLMIELMYGNQIIII